MTDLLWTLVALQIAMGAFDALFHHELTERLAWKPSQKSELRLHGVRNLIYAALFLLIGWAEPKGPLAVAVLILATGFRFRHPEVEDALRAIVGALPRPATGARRVKRLSCPTAGHAVAHVEGNISSRP